MNVSPSDHQMCDLADVGPVRPAKRRCLNRFELESSELYAGRSTRGHSRTGVRELQAGIHDFGVPPYRSIPEIALVGSKRSWIMGA